MSKDAPAPPDYAAAAEQQGQSSREVTEQQTWANRPTVNTPFGQQTWDITPTWDPATGQYINSWTQNTNLTPQAQNALDSQLDIQQGKSNLAESMLGRAQDEYGQPVDWSKYTSLAGTPNAPDYNTHLDSSQKYDQDAENAIYGKFSSRMEPQFQRQQDQTRTQLYNAGLREGDEAYDQQMKTLGQNQDDARQQAEYQAIIGSGSEAQRMQGMDQTAAGFENTAKGQQFGTQMQGANYQNQLRQQQIAEDMQKRGYSLNEINAILNGQQVGMPSMPGFSQANASQATQYLPAAQMQNQANLDQFNAQQGGLQGLMGGVSSLASAYKPFGF